jgi:hypothetical protein
MKKKYINPKAIVYRISSLNNLLAGSITSIKSTNTTSGSSLTSGENDAKSMDDFDDEEN